MNFIQIFLLVFVLHIIEINCGVTSLYPRISKFKESENETSSVDRMKKLSVSEGNSSNRSARFLGKLALVVGVGNKFFETNLTRPSINFSSLNSYSPYIAAVYEPFLTNLQSYIPFKWFFNSSPPNSNDATTTESPESTEEITDFFTDLIENQTVSKIEQNEDMEYKIIVDQDNETAVVNDTFNDNQGDAEIEYLSSTSQPMKNEALFFHNNQTTMENAVEERPVTGSPPDVLSTPAPTRRPRPPTTPRPRPPQTPRPRPQTPRPTRLPTRPTTIKQPPSTMRPTNQPMTPSSVVPSGTVTQNPVTNTFRPITPAHTTELTTTKIPTTTGINYDEINGTGQSTVFPGYYGGYPQNVNDLDLTTIPTPNDYNDIRDRLTNDYSSDYVYDNNGVNYVPEDFERATESVTGIQYFYHQPSKIMIQDKFRPIENTHKAWNYDYRLNQFV